MRKLILLLTCLSVSHAKTITEEDKNEIQKLVNLHVKEGKNEWASTLNTLDSEFKRTQGYFSRPIPKKGDEKSNKQPEEEMNEEQLYRSKVESALNNLKIVAVNPQKGRIMIDGGIDLQTEDKMKLIYENEAIYLRVTKITDTKMQVIDRLKGYTFQKEYSVIPQDLEKDTMQNDNEFLTPMPKIKE